MEIIITEDHSFCGRDILSLLKAMGLSSKMIKYLKYRDDGILVNGARVTVRHVLTEKDNLCLALGDPDSADCTPIDIALDVIYENDDLIVINKPPFMPTHTSHGHYDDTLANALAGYFTKKNVPFVFRPINRLDRNTSGLVLVAKNKPSAAFLSNEMRAHNIKKSYIAILDGLLPDPSDTVKTDAGLMGVIDKHLHRTAASIIVREVCAADLPDAEAAVTYYKVLGRSNGMTLVEAHPQTGRTHQLRVHFAFLGCPILGDDIYGTPSAYIKRHALHALTLSLPIPPKPFSVKPVSTEHLELRADIPEDMSQIIEQIFT